MFYKDSIDPWACMAPLGTVEFFKDSFRSQSQNYDPTCATRVGFQPLMDNPITWDQFQDFKDEVEKVINKHINNKFIFTMSWFVSYDKGGKQEPHSHKKGNADFSGVVCLLGNKSSGALCFENEKVHMEQGDIVLFDGSLKHWTEESLLPKTILAFDCSYVG